MKLSFLFFIKKVECPNFSITSSGFLPFKAAKTLLISASFSLKTPDLKMGLMISSYSSKIITPLLTSTFAGLSGPQSTHFIR